MLKLGLFGLTVAILAACGVYGLKNRVQDLEKELVRVEHKIEAEQIKIKRLGAEWATLSHPERLARLAETHLGLKPATPLQIATIADMPLRDGLVDEGAPALVSSLAPAATSVRPTSLRQ
ncbi:MAG: cell division protein FtsL [Geminicoccaceae bacterium]